MYNDPPYFVLIAGLLISLTSGAAFDAVLKQSVQDWQKNRSTRSVTAIRSTQLFIPFLGIALGICFFLSAGVETFGFPTKLAYAISIPMTIFISWLVWWQLGKILVLLQQGGSKALDLDSWG